MTVAEKMLSHVLKVPDVQSCRGPASKSRVGRQRHGIPNKAAGQAPEWVPSDSHPIVILLYIVNSLCTVIAIIWSEESLLYTLKSDFCPFSKTENLVVCSVLAIIILVYNNMIESLGNIKTSCSPLQNFTHSSFFFPPLIVWNKRENVNFTQNSNCSTFFHCLG